MEDKKVISAPVADTRKLDMQTPTVKDLLAAGVQFGHQTQKWNPKMKDYIFTSKNKIHVIDLMQTEIKLKEAAEFIFQAARKGNILFVGTKRQAAQIVKEAAVNSGSYFVTHRWPGGLLTNFKLIQKSLKKLNQYEDDFEKGVTNRTKFEVTQQKKDWERLSRIYEGVKTMERFPTAIIVVDSKYERLALKDAKALKIPVVAMVDTNCDPTSVEYAIPANDDAIKSITLVMNTLAAAIKQGNEGRGVKHMFKDYSTYEVKVVKQEETTEKVEVASTITTKEEFKPAKAPTSKSNTKSRGILEDIQSSKSVEANAPVKVIAEKKVAAKPVAKAATKPATKAVAKPKAKVAK